jgi:hypothetical protein
VSTFRTCLAVYKGLLLDLSRIVNGATVAGFHDQRLKGSPPHNRVGGGLTAPASHTTVRAGRHTAVRDKF